MIAQSTSEDFIMFALGDIGFVRSERFVWPIAAALKVLGWPLAAARSGLREARNEASTGLDAALRYDVGLSDINVAKIPRRPVDPMEDSRSLEGMFWRRW